MTQYEAELLAIERAKVNAKIAEIARALAMAEPQTAANSFNGMYTNIHKKVWEK